MQNLISKKARKILNNPESADQLIDFVVLDSKESSGHSQRTITVDKTIYSVSSSTAAATFASDIVVSKK